MTDLSPENTVGRRNFLKLAGAAGAALLPRDLNPLVTAQVEGEGDAEYTGTYQEDVGMVNVPWNFPDLAEKGKIWIPEVPWITIASAIEEAGLTPSIDKDEYYYSIRHTRTLGQTFTGATSRREPPIQKFDTLYHGILESGWKTEAYGPKPLFETIVVSDGTKTKSVGVRVTLKADALQKIKAQFITAHHKATVWNDFRLIQLDGKEQDYELYFFDQSNSISKRVLQILREKTAPNSDKAIEFARNVFLPCGEGNSKEFDVVIGSVKFKPSGTEIDTPRKGDKEIQIECDVGYD